MRISKTKLGFINNKVLICLAIASFGLFCLAVYYSKGYSFCPECFLYKWHDNIRILGFPIKNQKEILYGCTPQLKLAQQKCLHQSSGGGGVSGFFFGARKHYSSGLTLGGHMALEWEHIGGFDGAFSYLTEIRNDKYERSEDKKHLEDDWAVHAAGYWT